MSHLKDSKSLHENILIIFIAAVNFYLFKLFVSFILKKSLAMPMEMSSLPPPVGFQLVRDPSTGQFLVLPTTTTIGN